MKSKFITITSILLATLSLAACSDSGYESDDSYALLALLALSGASADLPQPALDTANMTLGGTAFTLTNKFTCASGGAGIGFTMAGGAEPTLNVHDIDFSATSVSVGIGASGLDIDANGGVYGASPPCAAKIIENSATIYDLQVKDCALSTQLGAPNPPTNTVSFRVRCTKG